MRVDLGTGMYHFDIHRVIITYCVNRLCESVAQALQLTGGEEAAEMAQSMFSHVLRLSTSSQRQTKKGKLFRTPRSGKDFRLKVCTCIIWYSMSLNVCTCMYM